MKDLDFKLEDFPDDPEQMDWDKEALVFYHHMLNYEDKSEKKILEIIKKFKNILSNISKDDVLRRKSAYNDLKLELYKLKDNDNSFQRNVYYLLLIARIVRELENSIETIISKKEQLKSLQEILNVDTYKKEIEILEQDHTREIEKSENEIIRVTRTESWRFVNEERLEEFRRKGYKYKTTYPVKDSKTAADSWYYYSQRQIKPIDEPFEYIWNGVKRVFMTPPDRPNDRNVLIPYVGDPDKFKNEIR